MTETDTVKLLRECDVGIRMGIESIDDVLPHVHSEPMHEQLTACRKQHDRLKGEIGRMLAAVGVDGKEPPAIARGMSHVKTRMRLATKPCESTVAELVIDGCHMGVKSLSRFLNRYEGADEQSRQITRDLIRAEDDLGTRMRLFL